jgi:large subunit ribosomal protein L10
MDNPRADKVAVVDEVRERLGAADASVVTEYRGLTVAELAELRRQLAAAGGDYKIFKNTLVRLAVTGTGHAAIEPLLTGPTGITFVSGDVSAVAKTLREFSRANPHLVVKGGYFSGSLLTAQDLARLAELPPREVLLAQMAGALAAPLRQMAGVLQALPRSLAYGLAALAEERRAAEPEAPAAEPAAAAPAVAEAPAPTEATDAVPTDAPSTDAPAAEAPAAEAPAETDVAEAPAAEGGAEAPVAEEAAESPAAEATETDHQTEAN